jgi:ferredoxin
MKTILFFMSGTGNSLWIAKRLASNLDGDVELTGLQSIRENTVVPVQRIGFVLPVYFSDIPEFAEKTIRLLSFPNAEYVFGVVTNGGAHGNALPNLKTAIERSGAKFDAGFSLEMPDNSIVFKTPAKIKTLRLTQCASKVSAIAEKITTNFTNSDSLRLRGWSVIYGALTRLGLLDLLGARRKWANTGCSGCGLCERFCPSGNIAITNGRPRFSNNCAQCFGCAHWCPNRAIQYGRCTITTHTHYTHPEITVEELLNFNSVGYCFGPENDEMLISGPMKLI